MARYSWRLLRQAFAAPEKESEAPGKVCCTLGARAGPMHKKKLSPRLGAGRELYYGNRVFLFLDHRRRGGRHCGGNRLLRGLLADGLLHGSLADGLLGGGLADNLLRSGLAYNLLRGLLA